MPNTKLKYKARVTKPKRKPGEKKAAKRKLKPLSPFSDPRVPTGHTNLTAFLLTCDKTTSIPEAVREYQEFWCDHGKKESTLISQFQDTANDRQEYTVACMECGRHKLYKGRPSTELTKGRFS